MTTKKEYLKQFDGKLFKVTRNGVMTLEEWPSQVQRIVQLAKDQGFRVLFTDQGDLKILDSNGFGTGQVYLKPKISKQESGIIKFTSKEYKLINESGDIVGRGDIPPASNFHSNGFTVMICNGHYEYELI